MSKLRTPSRKNRGSAWERIWDSLTNAGSRRRLSSDRKPRRLSIDQLEQRQLLSVSPVNANDVLINQSSVTDPLVEIISSGTGASSVPFWLQSAMLSGKSVAINNNGDFVVSWQSVDYVAGWTDPDTGDPMTDMNIYARYYTDAVQRVNLPSSLLPTVQSPATKYIKLEYNGNTVQKLTVSAGTEPFMGASNVAGTFKLVYTNPLNSTQYTTALDVDFDEADPTANAQSIQAALDDLFASDPVNAAVFDGVAVQAIDARNYQIIFGDASAGHAQQLLGVTDQNFTSGFLPAVDLTMTRNSGVTMNIPISSNPNTTAQNIAYAFNNATSTDYLIAPITFPIPGDVSTGGSVVGPYNYPEKLRTGLPSVTVTARSATEFDITFTGNASKLQQPLLEVLNPSTYDPSDDTYDPITGAQVTILKQSSDTFRVNAPEPDDPETIRPDIYDQKNPQVAMDTDGDFVITWEGAVPDVENHVSVSDIFARRFSPAGYVQQTSSVSFIADMDHDGVAETPIQGIRPLGSEFQVNTITTNPQDMPSVGVDGDGNFTIAWRSEAQGLSYFNSIQAQRYDRDGNPLGGEFRVNSVENTNIHFAPYVAMSRDGVLAIAWSETSDEENFLWFLDGGFATSWFKIYDADGAMLVDQQNVGAWLPTVAFDAADNFVVTCEYTSGGNDNYGGADTNVYAQQYQLYDPVTGALNFVQTQSQFRLNSATYDLSVKNLWPREQMAMQAVMDADGDLTASYSGYGPEVSENAWGFMSSALASSTIQTRIANAGLTDYFSPNTFDSNGDVEGVIRSMLLYAKNAHIIGTAATPITDVQLGQLRSILDSVAGLLRGEANGVMFSQFDAAIGTRTTIISSDDVANSHRDGRDSSYLLAIDSSVTGGSLALSLSTPAGRANLGDVMVYSGGVIDVAATMTKIHDTLSNSGLVGINWPHTAFEGPVAIRLVSSAEIDARMTTPWDFTTLLSVDNTYIVYEITFMGEIHDIGISLGIWENKLEGSTGGTSGNGPSAASILEMPGNSGTSQYDASIAMTSSGSFVMAWNEASRTNGGSFSATNLYFREFKESTDTVGPLVTDFLLPTTDGGTEASRLQEADTVRQSMHNVAVTFDSDMMSTGGTTGSHSVTNPNNWALMKDGVLVSGGISKIYYGMNEAATRLGLPASNKWEAVLVLNGSGDLSLTEADLTDGHYEIVATTSLRDKAGNALGRTGYTPNGYVFSREFDVALPTGTETRVNTITQADQYTSPSDEIQRITFTGTAPLTGTFTVSIGDYTGGDIQFDSGDLSAVAAEIQFQLKTAGFLGAVATSETGSSPYVFNVRFAGDDTGIDQPRIIIDPSGLAATVAVTELQKGTTAPPPQATASNGNGDYVVVWTSDTVGSAGVYAKIYPANWTATDSTNGHESNSPASPAEILITSNPTARYASVACDGVGNFVVTWSQQDVDGGWNIHARMFDKDGTAIGGEFGVNATLDDVQQYSTAGMDADGNFVIVWQSMNQDGSGWGVFGQRYDGDGNTIGGTNELDILSFEGNPVGSFRLHWNGQDTEEITYNGNPAAIVGAVQTALEGIGAHVGVAAISATEISIQFIGVDGNKNLSPMTVTDDNYTGDPGAVIFVSTRVDGATGEFRVNDTTVNSQMYPSIAMNATGSFVVGWTSYGQGDTAYDANVFAKQFLPSSALADSNSNGVMQQSTPSSDYPDIIYDPLIVTTDDLANHVVEPGSGLDGVVQLLVTRTDGGALGSGTLLADGRHILTAAHVVSDDLGNKVATSVEVVFAMATGNVSMIVPVESIFVNPGYTGLPWEGGYDLAVLTLPFAAPAEVERHDINRSTSAINQTITMVGYGNGGTGDTGDTVDTVPYGVKHSGNNKLEGNAGLIDSYSDALIYDFDNGKEENDAFGQILGINDLGLGDNEASGAPGDSGGPAFLGNGLIAGVISYGVSIPGSWDVLEGVNSSFGDMGGVVNVAIYADWIDIVMQGGLPEFRVNQTTADDQKWSSVAIDDAGDFVVTWTSYGQDGAGDGPGAGVNGENGVYVRRFNASGAPVGNDFLANTFTNKDQQYSRVAMNAAGDFVVVWESYQDRAAFDGTYPNTPDTSNSFGIYAQKYVRNELVGAADYTGPNGEIETEIPINFTQNGAQRYPSVAMDDNGDFLIVWSGNGEVTSPTAQSDTQGVFLQRFDRTTDTAGPQAVATFYDVNDPLNKVHDNDNISAPTVTRFIVVFSENVNNVLAGTPDWVNSVRNPNNWSISRDGVTIPGGVVVEGYNENTREVTLRLDADANEAGKQALSPLEYSGTYVITASSVIEDVFGNALDGDLDGTPGSDFLRTFTVSVMADITGNVYSDLNDDTVADLNGNITGGDADDLGLSDWTVWLDLADDVNPGGDGVADYTITTAFDGSYRFSDIPAGKYYVWQELKPGWNENYLKISSYEVVISAPGTLVGKNFFNIDTQAPSVTVDALAPTNNATPKLTGTVIDPGPGSGIVEVKVEISDLADPGVVLHTLTWAPSPADTVGGTTWIWSVKTADATTGLDDGEYLLTVTAEDNAGNTTVNNSQTFIIDTQSPTGLTLDTPTTRVTRPTLSGTVQDPVTSSGISSIMVAVDGRSPTAALVTFDRATGMGTWTLPWPSAWLPLSADVYDVKVIATDVAGNPNLTLQTTLTFDQIAPMVDNIVPVSPDPRDTSVDGVDVEFSEAINLSTFNVNDITFWRNNVIVGLSGSLVTVSHVSGTTATYRIDGLSSYTTQDAEYYIRVNAAGIQDLAGNTGFGSAYEVWIKDSSSPSIVSLTPVLPDPRNTPVDSVSVVFSELIDPSTFDYQDVTLTRNGATVPLSPIISTGFVSGTTYTIGGLRTFTSDGGEYTISISGAGIQDRAGHSGSGTVSDTWQMDADAPMVLSIVKTDLDPTNALQVRFVVTFNEPVVDVDAADFAIASSGITGASLVSVSPVSGPSAAYTVTVNTGSGDGTLGLNVKDIDSVRDLSGNLLGGAGADNGNFTGPLYTIDKTSPKDVLLSNTRVVEQQPIGTVVGVLATGGSTASPFTYALVPGPTGDDNALFEIVGNQLRTKAEFTDPTSVYTIYVRTTDAAGHSILQPKAFTIGIVPLSLTASVGDRVWNDLDSDATQDAGEPGIAGAIAEIFCAPDAAVYGVGADYSGGQTITDANGQYTLTGLLSGLNYYVVYRVPSGYTEFTTPSGGMTAKFTLADSQVDTIRDAGVLGSESSVPGVGFALRAGGVSDDTGQLIATDASGNVYVTGSFQGTVDFDPGAGIRNLTSAGGKDVFVAKYLPTGTLVWAINLGGAGDDSGAGIAIGPDGNVYVAGGFSGTANFGSGSAKITLASAGGLDAFVAKLDTTGKVLWAKATGGTTDDYANAVAVAADGSVYTTGYFQGTVDFDRNGAGYNLTSVGPKDAFVAKLDADGAFAWARRMGGIGWNQGISIGTSIAVDGNGNVLTTGSFQGVADFDPGAGQYLLTCTGDTDVFVSKLNASGNFVWARGMGGSGKDQGTGIAVAADGSVYTTGLFWGTADFDPSTATYSLNSDAYHRTFVSKLDSLGNFAWAHSIGGTGTDRAAGIALADDGSVFVTSGFQGTAYFDATAIGLQSAGEKDVFVAKLDSAGQYDWALNMGGVKDDYGASAALTAGGDLYVTGYFQGTADFDPGAGTYNLVSAGGQDLFIAKLIISDWDDTIPPLPDPSPDPLNVVSFNTVGLHSPTSSTFYLKDTNAAGPADSTFVYGPGASGWIPISGDWDGNGLDTIGLYSPTSSTFYLRNSNTVGVADATFVYGPAGAGWTPVVGDWDFDGIDTIGLYSPTTSTFYLRNSNTAGVADATFVYGPAGAGWTPVVGDWDFDGFDTIGLHSPTSSTFFLRNTNTAGVADATFVYGPAGVGWTPIVGDWNFNGIDTVGLYSPTSSTFFLRNTNTQGAADATFVYGPAGAGWTPIVGAWTPTSPLMAAEGLASTASRSSVLTESDLQPIVDEALARWKVLGRGLDAATLARLAQVEFVIGDLPGSYLGEAKGDRIYLDNDAAGHGWFVDSTPTFDEEFAVTSSGQLQAVDPRAIDRIDLLSVVEHELGHIAGFDDLDALADNLMSATLETGVRRSV